MTKQPPFSYAKGAKRGTWVTEDVWQQFCKTEDAQAFLPTVDDVPVEDLKMFASDSGYVPEGPNVRQIHVWVVNGTWTDDNGTPWLVNDWVGSLIDRRNNPKIANGDDPADMEGDRVLTYSTSSQGLCWKVAQ